MPARGRRAGRGGGGGPETARARSSRKAASRPSSSRSSTTSTSAPCSQRASAEVLAGGAQDRGGVGEAALDRLVERAVEAGHGRAAGPCLPAWPRRAPRPRPGAPARPPPGAATTACGPGRRPPARGEAPGRGAGRGALVQQARGEQRVVPGVPGQETAAEQRRLRDGAREVHHLQGIDAGHGAARRGQAARQLHRGGQGRHEKDDRPDPHDLRIICRAVAGRRSAPP